MAAAGLALLVCGSGILSAAPNLTGKKDEGFQTGVPNAILIEPKSDSILFEKNADQPVQPASLAKLMTLEYVFNEIAHGRLKLDQLFTISENAWRKGGAPSHGSTMFAAIHSQVSLSDLIQGIIVDSANDACMAIAESVAGNEAAFGQMLTKRAREIGLAAFDLYQLHRLHRSRHADDGAGPGRAGALYHQDLPPVLSVFRPARFHLEQDSISKTAIRCSAWGSMPTA